MTDSIIPTKVGNDRFDVALGLRGLAELLEASPKMPVPRAVRGQVSILDGDEATRIREVERLARLLGLDVTRNAYGVRAELRLVGNVSLILYAATDEGRARSQAENSYFGAVTP